MASRQSLLRAPLLWSQPSHHHITMALSVFFTDRWRDWERPHVNKFQVEWRDRCRLNGEDWLPTNATGSCKLAAISVKPGLTHCLRFIGATALSFLSLAIESHDMLEIIGVDGHYTKPVMISYLQISSGQWYSVLLEAKTEADLHKVPTILLPDHCYGSPNCSNCICSLRAPISHYNWFNHRPCYSTPLCS
jgi:FtsP/CotA-like multicopper oxidase with cupredoxin domain